ncbi:hypothetical protein Plhal703r1_c01g0004591 [Plasmopara halstedii]
MNVSEYKASNNRTYRGKNCFSTDGMGQTRVLTWDMRVPASFDYVHYFI